MYIDWTYIILVLPAVLFTMWASANVKSTYNKYSRQQNSRGMTGAQAARRVLDANGLQNVAIQQIEGELTDHYDPKANMIRLSADVYSGTSTAAIGVACHEVGHAIQYAQDYVPVKIRSAIIPVTNFGLAARACGTAAVLRRAGLHISGVYRGCVLRPVRSVPARDAAGGV